MKENGDLNFYAKNKTVFNTYIEMFERFGKRIKKSSKSLLKNAAKFIFFAAFFFL
jgi:deoxyhypusine synthase